MLKLVVFDLDNPLLDARKRLDASVVEAIDRLKASGIKVGIATGRTAGVARPFIDRIRPDAPVAYNNGSLIEHQGEVVHESTIPPETLRKLIREAASAGLEVVVYRHSHLLGPPSERMQFFEDYSELLSRFPVRITVTEDLDTLSAEAAHKLLIEDPSGESPAFERLFHRGDVHVTRSQQFFIDVTPKSAHKGAAIQRIMKLVGVSPEETAAFGDNDNDAEMLAAVRFSFAMKNATIKAKQAAVHVTALDAEHAGVADTLNHHDIFKVGENG